MSPLKRYVFDGQSLGAAPSYYEAYGSKFMALARPNNPYTIANIGGTHYSQREAGDENHTSKKCSPASVRVDQWLAQNPDNVLIDDGGGNEYGVIDYAPMTWEQVRDVKFQYCETRRAAGAQYIVGLTHTPGTDQPDTEFWFSASELAEIEEGNAAMIADPASFGYDQVIDIAAIPELQDPWNTTYFYDGVHFSSLATDLVAQKLAAELLV